MASSSRTNAPVPTSASSAIATSDASTTAAITTSIPPQTTTDPTTTTNNNPTQPMASGSANDCATISSLFPSLNIPSGSNACCGSWLTLGIQCNPQGYITNFDFSSKSLSGPIGSAIASLSQLDSFDLSKNGLSGDLPKEFASMQNLRTIQLYNNAFTGSINVFSGLKNLEVCRLANNKFTGTISSDWTLLKRLSELVDNNCFSSTDLGTIRASQRSDSECNGAKMNLTFILSIAGGALAVIVLIVVGVIYFMRRRRNANGGAPMQNSYNMSNKSTGFSVGGSGFGVGKSSGPTGTPYSEQATSDYGGSTSGFAVKSHSNASGFSAKPSSGFGVKNNTGDYASSPANYTGQGSFGKFEGEYPTPGDGSYRPEVFGQNGNQSSNFSDAGGHRAPEMYRGHLGGSGSTNLQSGYGASQGYDQYGSSQQNFNGGDDCGYGNQYQQPQQTYGTQNQQQSGFNYQAALPNVQSSAPYAAAASRVQPQNAYGRPKQAGVSGAAVFGISPSVADNNAGMTAPKPKPAGTVGWKTMAGWNMDQVAEALEKEDVMPSVINVLKANEVNGFHLLQLDDEILTNMGVESPDSREFVITVVNKLAGRPAGTGLAKKRSVSEDSLERDKNSVEPSSSPSRDKKRTALRTPEETSTPKSHKRPRLSNVASTLDLLLDSIDGIQPKAFELPRSILDKYRRREVRDKFRTRQNGSTSVEFAERKSKRSLVDEPLFPRHALGHKFMDEALEVFELVAAEVQTSPPCYSCGKYGIRPSRGDNTKLSSKANGVSSNNSGSSFRPNRSRTSSAKGLEEQRNEVKNVDAEEMVRCDFCDLWWHIGCLGPLFTARHLDPEPGTSESLEEGSIPWPDQEIKFAKQVVKLKKRSLRHWPVEAVEAGASGNDAPSATLKASHSKSKVQPAKVAPYNESHLRVRWMCPCHRKSAPVPGKVILGNRVNDRERSWLFLELPDKDAALDSPDAKAQTEPHPSSQLRSSLENKPRFIPPDPATVEGPIWMAFYGKNDKEKAWDSSEPLGIRYQVSETRIKMDFLRKVQDRRQKLEEASERAEIEGDIAGVEGLVDGISSLWLAGKALQDGVEMQTVYLTPEQEKWTHESNAFLETLLLSGVPFGRCSPQKSIAASDSLAPPIPSSLIQDKYPEKPLSHQPTPPPSSTTSPPKDANALSELSEAPISGDTVDSEQGSNRHLEKYGDANKTEMDCGDDNDEDDEMLDDGDETVLIPLDSTNIKAIQKLNDAEIAKNINDEASWHTQYADSAYVYVGGIPFQLTEGDLICVFSQWGEVVDVNLVRDKKTGKSKGFAFVAYEDQRSTVLAVDNFNGIQILSRTIRVDHVAKYRGDHIKKEETPEEREERLIHEREKRRAVVPKHLWDEELKATAKPEDLESSSSSSSEEEDNEDDEEGLNEEEKAARRRQREADAEDPMRAFFKEKEMKKKRKEKKKLEKEMRKKEKKEKKEKKSKKKKKEGDADDGDSGKDKKRKEKKRKHEHDNEDDDGVRKKRLEGESKYTADLSSRHESRSHDDRGAGEDRNGSKWVRDFERRNDREDPRDRNGRDRDDNIRDDRNGRGLRDEPSRHDTSRRQDGPRRDDLRDRRGRDDDDKRTDDRRIGHGNGNQSRSDERDERRRDDSRREPFSSRNDPDRSRRKTPSPSPSVSSSSSSESRSRSPPKRRQRSWSRSRSPPRRSKHEPQRTSIGGGRRRTPSLSPSPPRRKTESYRG
ncbi:RNA-binding motif protein, X-linked 2, partial [Phlyctochytrium planicorne]